MNHPLLLLLMTGAGLYCARLWWSDLKARPKPAGALPGAEPATARAVAIAVGGALVIVALETWGEFALGVAAEQSKMTALFALYSVCGAPIIEELIFRGFLVWRGGNRAAVWGAAIAASVVFAAFHPFLWHWDEAGFSLDLGIKGAFSTLVVFATSLWLYAARLGRWNPTQSLLPCFAAHAAKNMGVVAIKAAFGFVGGWW